MGNILWQVIPVLREPITPLTSATYAKQAKRQYSKYCDSVSSTLTVATQQERGSKVGYKDKEKQREYQRKWVSKRREEYFADKACAGCGSKESLELDHIDPKTKKYNPSSLWGMAKDNPNRIAELKKCQILCEECHKKKTSKYQSLQFGGDNSVTAKLTAGEV